MGKMKDAAVVAMQTSDFIAAVRSLAKATELLVTSVHRLKRDWIVPDAAARDLDYAIDYARGEVRNVLAKIPRE